MTTPAFVRLVTTHTWINLALVTEVAELRDGRAILYFLAARGAWDEDGGTLDRTPVTLEPEDARRVLAVIEYMALQPPVRVG